MNEFGKKTKLTVHLEIFRALCLKLKTLIYDAKEKCHKKQISDCGGDQKQLFGIVNSIFRSWKTNSISSTYRFIYPCFFIQQLFNH